MSPYRTDNLIILLHPSKCTFKNVPKFAKMRNPGTLFLKSQISTFTNTFWSCELFWQTGEGLVLKRSFLNVFLCSLSRGRAMSSTPGWSSVVLNKRDLCVDMFVTWCEEHQTCSQRSVWSWYTPLLGTTTTSLVCTKVSENNKNKRFRSRLV